MSPTIRATDHHINDNEPHSILIRGNGLEWSLELDRKTTEYGKERDVDIRELLESTDLIYIGELDTIRTLLDFHPDEFLNVLPRCRGSSDKKK